MRVRAIHSIGAFGDLHPPGTVLEFGETEGNDLVARGAVERLPEAPALPEPVPSSLPEPSTLQEASIGDPSNEFETDTDGTEEDAQDADSDADSDAETDEEGEEENSNPDIEFDDEPTASSNKRKGKKK